MKELWTKLESHFAKVNGALDDLRGPISQANKNALNDEAGQDSAADLLESLSIHDGQEGNLFLFGPYRLATSSSILESMKTGFLSSIFSKKESAASIPVADDGGNTELVLDLQTGTIRDVWEDGDHAVFASYRAFLEHVLSDLDNETIIFDEESSGYVVSGDPEAYWPTRNRSVGER